MENLYDKLPSLDEILKVVDKEASSKGLSVFVFENDDLDELFTAKYKDLVVVTIARDKDKAKWNLSKHRHSYIAKNK